MIDPAPSWTLFRQTKFTYSNILNQCKYSVFAQNKISALSPVSAGWAHTTADVTANGFTTGCHRKVAWWMTSVNPTKDLKKQSLQSGTQSLNHSSTDHPPSLEVHRTSSYSWGGVNYWLFSQLGQGRTVNHLFLKSLLIESSHKISSKAPYKKENY